MKPLGLSSYAVAKAIGSTPITISLILQGIGRRSMGCRALRICGGVVARVAQKSALVASDVPLLSEHHKTFAGRRPLNACAQEQLEPTPMQRR